MVLLLGLALITPTHHNDAGDDFGDGDPMSVWVLKTLKDAKAPAKIKFLLCMKES